MDIKKIIHSSIVVLTGCLFSSFCHANGWSGYGTFTSLQCFSDNNAVAARCMIVDFNGTANDALINYCGKPWGALYIPAESAANATQLYSTILTAFAAGKQMKIYTNGCFEGFPLIGGVSVKY